MPPYVGHRGWVGLRLDLPEVDWDEVAGVIEDAHAYVLDRRAPQRRLNAPAIHAASPKGREAVARPTSARTTLIGAKR